MSLPRPKSKYHVAQLFVVFDTNVVIASGGQFLLNRATADLVRKTRSLEFELTWCLPQMVLFERQHQMQKEAAKLLTNALKLERLLGRPETATPELVERRVEEVVANQVSELQLRVLPLSVETVPWDQVIRNSFFRRPPFEPEGEKGFRDAMIIESVVQFAETTATSPQTCIVAFVTGDQLLQATLRARLHEARNVRFLDGLPDVVNLINVLASEVEEEFIERLRSDAQRLFANSANRAGSLFETECVGVEIEEKFAGLLHACPKGAMLRENSGGWTISQPQFVSKQGRRVHWVSNVRFDGETFTYRRIPTSPIPDVGSAQELSEPPPSWWEILGVLGAAMTKDPKMKTAMMKAANVDRVRVHTGGDTFAVRWSATVSTQGALRSPKIDGIEHVGAEWRQADQPAPGT